MGTGRRSLAGCISERQQEQNNHFGNLPVRKGQLVGVTTARQLQLQLQQH